MGGVDGSRIWAKELNMSLKLIQWAPDNRVLLFFTTAGEGYKYDTQGTQTVECIF